jgi:hypothetical protein
MSLVDSYFDNVVRSFVCGNEKEKEPRLTLNGRSSIVITLSNGSIM